jgi:hypothetical protein
LVGGPGKGNLFCKALVEIAIVAAAANPHTKSTCRIPLMGNLSRRGMGLGPAPGRVKLGLDWTLLYCKMMVAEACSKGLSGLSWLPLGILL